MCSWQLRRVRTSSLNFERHLSKSSHGSFTGSGAEPEEFFLSRKRRRPSPFPQVLNDCGIGIESTFVLARTFECTKIEHGGSGHQQLQFFRSQDVETRIRHDLVEASHELIVLRRDAVYQEPLHVEHHVLFLVGRGHGDVGATGYQLFLSLLTEIHPGDFEIQAEHVLRVIPLVVQEALESIANIFVDQIFQTQRKAEEFAIDRVREVDVQYHAVVYR
mmetsp:Transcript_19066/g.44113  ORF Transcript_19066/g.44113 Transcript_19066/m.44113 type:complete len:218 (-) Transcript_19066:905-1558(-)